MFKSQYILDMFNSNEPMIMTVPQPQPLFPGGKMVKYSDSEKDDPTSEEILRRKSTRQASYFPRKSITAECLLLRSRSTTFDDSFYEFKFELRNLAVADTPNAILHIFRELEFDKKYHIPQTALNRFVICARQGYRDLPYHNWMHACSVTHFSFLLIRNLELVENGYITDLQAFALIVSSLTHDIDHRGTSNQFEVCSESCLYKLYREYDTSIMERHHLDFTVAILNRDDCNLLQFVNEKDKKEFFKLISHNILATDISKHILNRDHLFQSLHGFNKSNKEFRFALLSCCMTISDLSDSAKNWDDNLPIMSSIFAEFFSQGDEERNMGWRPATMLDRNHAYIPDIEIKFLNYLVRPVFENMAKLFPQLKICVENVNYFCELWLLSTEVFNKYEGTHDPLDILDLKEMREKQLRRLSNPQLMEQLRKTDFSKMRSGSLDSELSLKSFKIDSVDFETSKWCCCIPKFRRKK